MHCWVQEKRTMVIEEVLMWLEVCNVTQITCTYQVQKGTWRSPSPVSHLLWIRTIIIGTKYHPRSHLGWIRRKQLLEALHSGCAIQLLFYMDRIFEHGKLPSVHARYAVRSTYLLDFRTNHLCREQTLPRHLVETRRCHAERLESMLSKRRSKLCQKMSSEVECNCGRAMVMHEGELVVVFSRMFIKY